MCSSDLARSPSRSTDDADALAALHDQAHPIHYPAAVERLGDRARIEDGVPEPAVRSLRAAGGFGVTEGDSFGHAHVIRQQGGSLLAGSDPRADGSAAAG